jgi:ATP adenylyltransferase
MKNLWAPWRKEFILGAKPKGCIFCKMPRKKEDRKNLILYRGNHNYIILNRFPYNNGHLMVVPFRHTKDLSKLTNPENAELLKLGAIAVKSLDKTMFPQGHNLGINLGAAGGAGIRDHLHLHVVPRWVGDTNWMPILSQTKVMIEYLEETYDRLVPVIHKLSRKRG